MLYCQGTACLYVCLCASIVAFAVVDSNDIFFRFVYLGLNLDNGETSLVLQV